MLNRSTDQVALPPSKIQILREPSGHSGFYDIADRLTVKIRKLQVSLRPIERPMLALNVQLMGELQETSFQERQWLIQRDGHFIQLSELLYRIADQIDGKRTLEQIAARVTETTDWIVSPDQVQRIIQAKFMPMGLIALPAGSGVPGAIRVAEDQPRSVFKINMRFRFMGPRMINPFTWVLQCLYAPPVFMPLLALIALAHGWLYFVYGLSSSLQDVLDTPALMFIVIPLLFVSNIFHELGHASALRYGGGKVRAIGMGFYLVYPVFYTDVTDSYRLGRWARVRVDIGGMYFHLIFTLGLMAAALLSGHQFLFALVMLIDLDILSENMPFVRFDGYWALADLTGLPDFFSLIGPFLRSILPLQPGGGDNKLPSLKPWVRGVFLGYIMITAGVLAVSLVLLVIYEPSLIEGTWRALLAQRSAFVAARYKTDVLGMLAPAVQEVLLTLPLVGNIYLLFTLSWTLIRTLWNWSRRVPRWIKTSVLVTTVVVVLVAFLWIPQLPFVDAPTPSVSVVDGIPCAGGEHTTEHAQAQLTIYVHGRKVVVPQGIGIPAGGNCLYGLHTRLSDGIIHVETLAKTDYTLGQFVDIWAHSKQTTVLTSDSFLGYPLVGHQLVIWTSDNEQAAQRYTGSLRDVVLRNHEIITIAYDSPQVKPVTSFDLQHSRRGIMLSMPRVA